MKNKGYTLLFAILITSLVLSVTISILSIARKEIILSSAATESQIALFTADSAVECAIYWDVTNASFATSSTATTTITCNPGGFPPTAGNNVYVSPAKDVDQANPLTKFEFTFVVPFPSDDVLGTEKRCASVVVRKTKVSADGLNFWATAITARGYNIGYNNSDPANPNCSTISPKKVERAIEFTY